MTVLKFENVSVEANSGFCFDNLNLVLYPGELILFWREQEQEPLLIPDLAQGLIDPDRGNIYFMQQNWRLMPYKKILNSRSLIGRVYFPYGMISNLSVMENILLSQRHHSRRNAKELIAEATNFSQMFMADIPQRVSFATAENLMQAQWIRAFMGNPKLIILEYPELGVSHEKISLLIETVKEKRNKGIAFVWMTSSPSIWNNISLLSAKRYKYNRQTMNFDITGVSNESVF